MAQAGNGSSPGSPLDLLKKFYILQEERVEAYKFLESGFSAYLEGAPHYNFTLYRSLVHEITQSFKTISEEAIAVERELREKYGLNRVADCILHVQDAEKLKLELTVQSQINRQEIIDYPLEHCHEMKASELKEQLQSIIETINEHMQDLKYESEELYAEEQER